MHNCVFKMCEYEFRSPAWIFGAKIEEKKKNIEKEYSTIVFEKEELNKKNYFFGIFPENEGVYSIKKS